MYVWISLCLCRCVCVRVRQAFSEEDAEIAELEAEVREREPHMCVCVSVCVLRCTILSVCVQVSGLQRELSSINAAAAENMKLKAEPGFYFKYTHILRHRHAETGRQ